MDNTNKSEHIYDEIQVNLLAAKMGLAFSDKKESDDNDTNSMIETSQYEVAYNAASLHLACGQLDEARKQLETARSKFFIFPLFSLMNRYYRGSLSFFFFTYCKKKICILIL